MHELEPSNYQEKDAESGWLWKCCVHNVTLNKDSDGANYVSETRILFLIFLTILHKKEEMLNSEHSEYNRKYLHFDCILFSTINEAVQLRNFYSTPRILAMGNNFSN